MGNITHTKVSAIPDGDDDSLVKPSDWNADHEVSNPVADHDVATKQYVDDADELQPLLDGSRAMAELRLTPKESSSGPEGTMFYDSVDKCVYVGVE